MKTAYLLSLLLLPLLLSAVEVSLTSDGLSINGGKGLGSQTLEFPALTGTGGGERRAPDKVDLKGSQATLRYPGGAQLALTLAPEGAMRIHATDLTANDKGISFRTTLPVSLAGQARWSIDGSEAKTLPETKSADAFIWRGDAKRFTLTDLGGKGCSVVIEHGYSSFKTTASGTLTASSGSPSRACPAPVTPKPSTPSTSSMRVQLFPSPTQLQKNRLTKPPSRKLLQTIASP